MAFKPKHMFFFFTVTEELSTSFLRKMGKSTAWILRGCEEGRTSASAMLAKNQWEKQIVRAPARYGSFVRGAGTTGMEKEVM